MVEMIAETTHTARKEHRCDSCLGIIRPGQTYRRQANKDGGDFYTFKEHDHCYRAIQAAIHFWPSYYLDDGYPRVVDLEEEDREAVAAEDPDAFIAIWGSA